MSEVDGMAVGEDIGIRLREAGYDTEAVEGMLAAMGARERAAERMLAADASEGDGFGPELTRDEDDLSEEEAPAAANFMPVGVPDPSEPPRKDEAAPSGRRPMRTAVPKEERGYVISVCGRIRRLHLLGACWMVPGRDYAQWESYGRSRPAPDTYTTFCKRCWGSRGGEPGSEDEVDTASDPEVQEDEEDDAEEQQAEA